MNRHLQERMIGAVVLVAVAIILIPEMLSGPHATHEATSESAPAVTSDGAKLKTYSIDLSKPTAAIPTEAPPLTIAETPVATPASKPIETTETPAAAKATSTPDPKTTTLESPNPEPSKPNATVKSETPAAKTPAPKGAEPATPPSGWAVQVGSFSERMRSQRIVQELKNSGFPGFIVAFEVKGQTMYRVRVGPARDRPAAESLLKRLKSKYPNATLVAPP